MKRVRAGAGRRVDRPSGSLTVVRGRIACHNRKLLHRVYAEHSARDAARSTRTVVVDAHSIQPIVVSLGTIAPDSHIRAKSAVRSAVAHSKCLFGPDLSHARLKKRQ